MTTLDDKIRTAFGEFAVDKGLIRRMGVSGDDRHVPSYVMDWIVTYTAKTQKTTSSLERAVQEFIAKHLPAKGEKERIRFKLAQGEVLTVLDAVSVTVKLGREVRYLASIPCLDENKASIDESLLVQNEGLLQGSTWGAAKICYDASDDGGGVRIIDFKPMQAGRVSLEAFCEARRAFTHDEWIDLIIRTLGYEPTRYGEQEKSWLLCRLIPVVHNRINMMELAPPGSGKSYVYNNVSRHVLLTTGDISPAVLFYNRQSKMPGVLTRYDLLVLDEAQSIHFSKADEIQAQLKGYLEQGVCRSLPCLAVGVAPVPGRAVQARAVGRQARLHGHRAHGVRTGQAAADRSGQPAFRGARGSPGGGAQAAGADAAPCPRCAGICGGTANQAVQYCRPRGNRAGPNRQV
jgi:ATP-dependent Lon protease